MGFGAVAATAILVAALAVGGTNLLDAALDAQQRLDDAAQAANARTLARGQTVLTVAACWDTSEPDVGANDVLYVFASNDGTLQLDASLAVPILDGTIQPLDATAGDTSVILPTQASLLAQGVSTSAWPPGTVLRWKIDNIEGLAGSSTAPSRVGVVTEHGVLAFDALLGTDSDANGGNGQDLDSDATLTMARCR